MSSLNNAICHPGAFIRENILPRIGKTVEVLAVELDVPIEYFKKVTLEEAPVTPELAHKLAEALDTSPRLWMNLQKSYDISKK